MLRAGAPLPEIDQVLRHRRLMSTAIYAKTDIGALRALAGGRCGMSGALRRALTDYLAVRRSLGFKMAGPEKLLGQFISYLDQAGAVTVTTGHALAWAVLPGSDPSWHAYRLAVVRGFATWLRTIDLAAEIPPAGLIPSRKPRATPYLYAGDEVTALIAAAASLRFPLRTATNAPASSPDSSASTTWTRR